MRRSTIRVSRGARGVIDIPLLACQLALLVASCSAATVPAAGRQKQAAAESSVQPPASAPVVASSSDSSREPAPPSETTIANAAAVADAGSDPELDTISWHCGGHVVPNTALASLEQVVKVLGVADRRGSPPTQQITVRGPLLAEGERVTTTLTYPTELRQNGEVDFPDWNAVEVDGRTMVKLVPFLAGLKIGVELASDGQTLRLWSAAGAAELKLQPQRPVKSDCPTFVNSPEYGSIRGNWNACSSDGKKRARSVKVGSWYVEDRARRYVKTETIAVEDRSTGVILGLLRSDEAQLLKSIAWHADSCHVITNFHYADQQGGGRRTCLSQFDLGATEQEGRWGAMGETLQSSQRCRLPGYGHRMRFDGVEADTLVVEYGASKAAAKAARVPFPFPDDESCPVHGCFP